MTHEVRVLCNCDDIECCAIERYVADVRIAVAELHELQGFRAEVERVWGTGIDVLRKTA